jgi:hypothetical protein
VTTVPSYEAEKEEWMKSIEPTHLAGLNTASLAALLLAVATASYGATVAEYVKRLNDQGYRAVRTDDPQTMVTTIRVEKLGESEETHGLLKQTWQTRDTWKLHYMVTGNELQFQYMDSYKEQKAPLLGQWRRVDIAPPIFPASLLEKTLTVR